MDEGEKAPLIRSRTNGQINRNLENHTHGSINDDIEDILNSSDPLIRRTNGEANCFPCCHFSSTSLNQQTLHFVPGPEVGPLDANLESLDYDQCENELFMNEEKLKSYNEIKMQRLARWVVMFLIGLFTALIACLIDILVSTFSNMKFGLLVKYFNVCQSVENQNNPNCLLVPLAIWVAWNVVCVSIASFITVYGEPVAAGSGIPQIKCFLNGVKIPHVVRIKTLMCKVIGVTSSVVGGLAVGKEGPMIHSGAVVAAGISQGRSTSFGFDLKLFEYFRTDQEKRDFVSGGAAAGVSAAFGAPVGGVLFSLEEGASFWNQALTWRIFFASIVSTFTLNIILSWFNGIPWQLSHPGLINFGKFGDMKYSAVEIPFFILIGILGGLFGAFFNFINLKLTLFRMRNIRGRLLKFLEALLVAMTTTTCAYLLIFFDSYCQPIRRDPNPNPLQMFCPDGKSSSMATLWFQSPESSLKSLFHDPFGTYELSTLISFGLLYYLLACWTYGCQVPSGLFIPSLVIGASWGRLLSIMLRSVWTFDPDGINPGKFALLGAASQLGGVVRMTLSLTVILIEATGNISFAMPLMIVLMVAKWTGDLFNEGIYDLHIQINGVPFLGAEPPVLTSNTLAREVMSYPVTTLQEVDTVRHVVDVLTSETHDAFPVVGRSTSLRLTKKKKVPTATLR